MDVLEPVSTGTLPLHMAGTASQLFGDQMQHGESVLQTCFALNKLVPQAVQVTECLCSLTTATATEIWKNIVT